MGRTSRQLDAKYLRVYHGKMQDATFIQADPGSSKKTQEGIATTRHSREELGPKREEERFWLQAPSKMQSRLLAIQEIETTTAKVHDRQVDLSIEDELSSEIEDTLGCLLKVTTLLWCAGRPMRLWESWIKENQADQNIEIARRKASCCDQSSIWGGEGGGYRGEEDYNLYQQCTLKMQ